MDSALAKSCLQNLLIISSFSNTLYIESVLDLTCTSKAKWAVAGGPRSDGDAWPFCQRGWFREENCRKLSKFFVICFAVAMGQKVTQIIGIWDCGIVVSASKISCHRSPLSVSGVFLCLVSLVDVLCLTPFLGVSGSNGPIRISWISTCPMSQPQCQPPAAWQVEGSTKNGIRVKFPLGRRQAQGLVKVWCYWRCWTTQKRGCFNQPKIWVHNGNLGKLLQMVGVYGASVFILFFFFVTGIY